jgi:hypothetical protein
MTVGLLVRVPNTENKTAFCRSDFPEGLTVDTLPPIHSGAFLRRHSSRSGDAHDFPEAAVHSTVGLGEKQLKSGYCQCSGFDGLDINRHSVHLLGR